MKNSFKMGMGVVLSQLLNLLYIPLFSRIFAQEAYAVQGNFLSILNIFFVFCSLGLASAMAVPKKAHMADLILKVILQFAFLVCLLILVVFLLLEFSFSIPVIHFVFKSDNQWLAFLFPVTAFARTVMFVYEVRISLLGNFKLLSISKIIGAFVYGLGVFMFFNVNQTQNISLIIGNTLSYLVIGIMLFRFHRIDFIVVPFRYLGYVIKRYRNFLYFSLPNTLLNALSSSVPIILLLSYYGEVVAGNYAMSLKIVAIPVSFIVASLRAVYLKKLSELYKNSKHKFHFIVKRILWYSHLGSFVIFALIFLMSQWLTGFALGDEWKETYLYIQIMCPWYFLLVGNSPLSLVFDIIEKQKENFIREILLLVFRVLSITMSFYMGFNGIFAICMFVLVSVLFNIVLSWMILSFSKNVTSSLK